jgi:predicted enzyme related to lactoylglutathione lyase
MHSFQVAAVMVHVPDAREGLAWYQHAFSLAKRDMTEDQGFEFLRLGPIQIEVVPSDEKVSSGPSGSVVYWWVEDLTAALAHLEGIGATLYRGPMLIEGGLSMCQVQDPWGNCIGLRGPQP